jgi:hypothetical protein
LVENKNITCRANILEIKSTVTEMENSVNSGALNSNEVELMREPVMWKESFLVSLVSGNEVTTGVFFGNFEM